jgi:type II secretory pathway pseudopilin PulG
MVKLKTCIKDVVFFSMRATYQVILSLAIVGFLLMLTLSLWMPRVEKEILGMCKDYHAAQTALETYKAWASPVTPLTPFSLETPFK